MKKTLTVIVLPILLFSSPMIYADAGNILELSTVGAQSSQISLDSSNSEGAQSGSIALLVAGGVTVVVGTVILTVHAAKVKKERMLGLQDQIYLADGKDYRDLLNFFALDERDLIKANDELVAAGYQITSDQDAADYLAALIRKLAERSQKMPYQVSVL